MQDILKINFNLKRIYQFLISTNSHSKHGKYNKISLPIRSSQIIIVLIVLSNQKQSKRKKKNLLCKTLIYD